MSRKEAVLLVSRALAIIQFVTALLDISYLPERFISLYHHERVVSVLATAGTDTYFQTLDRVGMVFMLMRIAGLLILTVVFWNCGSWFERVLLPKQEIHD